MTDRVWWYLGALAVAVAAAALLKHNVAGFVVALIGAVLLFWGGTRFGRRS